MGIRMKPGTPKRAFVFSIACLASLGMYELSVKLGLGWPTLSDLTFLEGFGMGLTLGWTMLWVVRG